MIDNYKPVLIAEGFYKLGTPSFPVYLSLGEDGMIIEGGTGGVAAIIVEQLRTLGVEPKRIKYVALTHTHTDHIGAVPHLKKVLPHLETVASPVAAKLLANGGTMKEFLRMDRILAEIMLAKDRIAGLPQQVDGYVFEVDRIVGEGDSIDLGSGVSWAVYETPGHSPCHISLYNESQGIVVVGDATGFYVPEKDTFWPNYFNSLEAYCESIRKLAALPARRGVLSHNYVIEEDVAGYFRKALGATESYHREMLARLGKGEDTEEIALDKARWVNTLTDDHPFDIMYSMAKILLRRSQAEADKNNLFSLP